jgi:serine/threonine-protein kinase
MRQLSPSVPKKAVRFSMEAAASVDPSTRQQALLLSPTGDRIVYQSRSGLVVRELDQWEGRVIPGTAGVLWPFFSPDGKWLGFRDPVDFSLKKVSLTGGAPLFLCKGVANSLGATWGPDDMIVFASDFTGLWQVPASGGQPRELTKPDRARGEKTLRWPHYLPGGQAVLFTVGTSRLTRWDDARIDVLVLRTGERRTILEGGSAAVYVESGHLVYQRGASLFAVPFDLDRLATTGTPVAVVDGVQSNSNVQGGPSFTLARTGMLAYVPHTRNAQRLVRVNRAGEAQPLTPWTGGVRCPRLSPDGRVVAAMIDGANEQVWRFDIERETFSQVTFEWDNQFPVWTPDGEFLIVSSGPGGQLRRVRADGGSGSPEPLLAGKGFNRIPGSVTADGKFLAYYELGTNTLDDIWVMSLERDAEPRVLVQTRGTDDVPAISPNGRFLAYESDESGRFEIYLRSFPDGGHRIQVSDGGGVHPVWARSGKELFYQAPLEGSRWRMMVADLSQEDPLRIARGRGLFEIPFARAYDVFPDGQHFAMLEIDQEASRITHFNAVLNWFEELQRLVPTR